LFACATATPEENQAQVETILECDLVNLINKPATEEPAANCQDTQPITAGSQTQETQGTETIAFKPTEHGYHSAKCIAEHDTRWMETSCCRGECELSLGIVVAEYDFSAVPINELYRTRHFTTISVISSFYDTPTLRDLKGYDVLLVYTNNAPEQAEQLGDVLADYVDSGGSVVLATYSFSYVWSVSGRIFEPKYSPWEKSGRTGVSGNLEVTEWSDPMFNNLNTDNIRFFSNSNYANPILRPEAVRLATDGQGHEMIARNHDNNVVAMNIYPGIISPTNQETYNLIGNALKSFFVCPAPVQIRSESKTDTAASCCGVCSVNQQCIAWAEDGMGVCYYYTKQSQINGVAYEPGATSGKLHKASNAKVNSYGGTHDPKRSGNNNKNGYGAGDYSKKN